MPILTKALVEKLDTQESDYLVWDDKISGFGVKITPQGRKVYLMKYRIQDGRQRKPSIGIHGNITCEQARKIAEKWHGMLAIGEDPFAERLELRQSPTVAELCDRFLTDHAEIHKKANGLNQDRFYIRKHIKPQLGMLKTASVTRQDIVKFHLGQKSTPAQANRMLHTLSKMFNLAEDWGLRPRHSNPVQGIQKYKEEGRERYLTDKEIEKLGSVLEKEEKSGAESPHVIALFRLLLLTGARLSEIRDARWEWINLDMGTLQLPDSKTGKKTIYLSPAAMEVLKNIPRLKNNPYVIVGSKEGCSLVCAKHAWYRVRKKAGIEDVRIHDLRHTFASICVGQGFTIQMVAKLLGHSQVRTSERYAHLADNPIKSAVDSIGKHISGFARQNAN